MALVRRDSHIVHFFPQPLCDSARLSGQVDSLCSNVVCMPSSRVQRGSTPLLATYAGGFATVSALATNSWEFMCLTSVEVSKLTELNAAGGYDWGWQKEAKRLEEKLAREVQVGDDDGVADSAAALRLSMDKILMVRLGIVKFTSRLFRDVLVRKRLVRCSNPCRLCLFSRQSPNGLVIRTDGDDLAAMVAIITLVGSQTIAQLEGSSLHSHLRRVASMATI